MYIMYSLNNIINYPLHMVPQTMESGMVMQCKLQGNLNTSVVTHALAPRKSRSVNK